MQLKNTWPKIYFSEGSVPPSDPAFPTAVTRSGGRACGSVLVQLRSHFWSKSPHCSPSPDFAAQQDGLSCANWIALPETRRAEALQKRIRQAPTAGTISVHTARLELVRTPWNRCDVDTGTSTLQHDTLLCVALPARASRAVPPPLALLRSHRQGAELWSPCLALGSLLSLGCCVHLPAWAEDEVGRRDGRQSTPNHFQRSCFQLGQGTAESFSCRMSYGCV